MSAGLYKEVLLGLHDKVMPHFTSPLLLSDFLTESYNIGEDVSTDSCFILFHTHTIRKTAYFVPSPEAVVPFLTHSLSF